jgi:rhodanese-related sulfurtransferase
VEPTWVVNHRHALTLVDVRGAEEFHGPGGHLAGSLFIPLPELQERLAEIPPERPVVMLATTAHPSGRASWPWRIATAL